MSLKFWTTLQLLKQAVYIEDGKIMRGIPAHPPKTIFRRAAVVTEYENKLALIKQASFELWDRETNECYRTFYHKNIYTPHAIVQYGKDLLICSSGLDMFFIMDIEGDVKWEWWGYQNGIGGKNEHYFKDDWVINQTTSDLCDVPQEIGAHFNSIYMTGEKTFISGALRKKKIVEITIGQEGFKLIADVEEQSCHSPFFYEGKLIYGTEAGIKVNDKKILPEYQWIKYVRPFQEGFAFTHGKGLVITDKDWNILEEVALPMPFSWAFLERT